MAIVSAGLLMYRRKDSLLEVFLVHPGGPYFKNKNSGFWGIPKGQVEPSESYFEAAVREFTEETGIIPHGEFIPLDRIEQPSGKIVYAWAFPDCWDQNIPLKSNTFTLEWPPHSGNIQQFPEIDKAEFFTAEAAKQKIMPSQLPFVERLEKYFAAQQTQSE